MNNCAIIILSYYSNKNISQMYLASSMNGWSNL